MKIEAGRLGLQPLGQATSQPNRNHRLRKDELLETNVQQFQPTPGRPLGACTAQTQLGRCPLKVKKTEPQALRAELTRQQKTFQRQQEFLADLEQQRPIRLFLGHLVICAESLR